MTVNKWVPPASQGPPLLYKCRTARFGWLRRSRDQLLETARGSARFAREMDHPLESLEVVAHILQGCSARLRFCTANAVCKVWRRAADVPGHACIDLSIQPLYRRSRREVVEQCPTAWFARRIRAGGAFECAYELVLANHSTLGGEALGSLDKLVHLRLLDLDDCQSCVDDKCLRAIARLPLLEELSLLGDGMPHITDMGIAHLATLPKLWALKLDACAKQVTNAGIISLKPLERTLESLVLSGRNGWRQCFGAESTLRHIATQFPNLSGLNLGGFGKASELGLHPDAWAELRALPRLSFLGLVEAEIDDVGLVGIGQISSLTRLDLSLHDAITDSGLAHLSALVNLRVLDLSNPECQLGYDAYTHAPDEIFWPSFARLSGAGLAALLPLAVSHHLEWVDIGGNHLMFDGAIEALTPLRNEARFDPSKVASIVVSPYEQAFWCEEHPPCGANVRKLCDYGVLVNIGKGIETVLLNDLLEESERGSEGSSMTDTTD